MNVEPGEDNRFSSKQIAAMMFGDKEAETIAKIVADRRNTDVDTEIKQKQRIPLEVLNSVNAEAFGAMAAILRAHKGKALTDEVIMDLQSALRDIPHKLKWTQSV